jgi:hypothetical protein
MDHEQRRSEYYYQLNPIDLEKILGFLVKIIKEIKPSSVYIFMEKPRGSRTVSAEPLSPARNIQKINF